mmetsp:Transcript_11634/g.21461  ORF Transcript_11634/g.21461 Transcript_11634/m.21461 type:complete len:559 (+) Transcript_11634:30-1706(+)
MIDGIWCCKVGDEREHPVLCLKRKPEGVLLLCSGHKDIPSTSEGRDNMTMTSTNTRIYRSQTIAASIRLAFIVTTLLCNLSLCVASSRRTFETITYPTQVPLFKRKLQSWMIRQKSQSKSAQRMLSRFDDRTKFASKKSERGSFLTLEHPTKEKLFVWFGEEGEDPSQVLRCMISRMQYNHDKVGITNPFLHVLGHDRARNFHDNASKRYNSEEEHSLLLQANKPKTKKTLQVCKVSPPPRQDEEKSCPNSLSMERCWWPSLQTSPNAIDDNNTSERNFFSKRKRQTHKKHKDDWKILVYRKRVGRGRACYERVRDAALDWEFQSPDGTMGLLEIPRTPPRGSKVEQQQAKYPKSHLPRSSSRYSVRPIETELLAEGRESSTHRSLGASSRRLVSFASKPLTGFLPPGLKKRLYAINPVMVVYDVIDAREAGTTFTSTAFATLKGHWLSGEERVTVAFRDGGEDVDVEILSISRPGPSIFGKALWPFLGKMQSSFFQQHLQHLAQTAADAPSRPILPKDPTENRELQNRLPSKAPSPLPGSQLKDVEISLSFDRGEIL